MFCEPFYRVREDRSIHSQTFEFLWNSSKWSVKGEGRPEKHDKINFYKHMYFH